MNEPVPLILVSELGDSGVAAVETPYGTLAIGISDGQPFAVSDRCRHLLASLGKGRVAEDGCLECPRHGARYDVRDGTMTRGPQGIAFFAARDAIRLGANAAAPLSRYQVEERDGVLYLLPGR